MIDGATPPMPDLTLPGPVLTEILPPSGRYAKACAEGRIWCLATPEAGVSIVAANTSPSPALTGSPLVGLYNPGTGYKASILRAVCFPTNVNPDSGNMFWNGIAVGRSSIAPSFGPPARNASTLQPLGDGSIQTYSGSGTALGVGPGILLRGIGGFAQVQANIPEETAGALQVMPGNFLGIYAVNIASGVYFASIEFEILPL